jgi:hypothetical protein
MCQFHPVRPHVCHLPHWRADEPDDMLGEKIDRGRESNGLRRGIERR